MIMYRTLKIIPLTRGASTIVDAENFDELIKYKWHLSTEGYAVRRISTGKKSPRQTNVPMHRQIMSAITGQMIDHKNGDKLDNRKDNLRFCTRGENARNCRKWRKSSTSGYKGVHLTKNSGWAAKIYLDSKRIFLGYYKTQEEAALAYNKAAILYHGEFAKLNEIKGQTLC